MKVTRVQYTVQPTFVEQNKKNIEAVMSEVRSLNNRDLKYASYLLDDGKTFMHLVHTNSAEAEQVITNLASFSHFRSELASHFEVPPRSEGLALVEASFGIF